MSDRIFSPAFGNRPSTLVGRSSTLDAILGGLDSRPGSKERSTLMLGQRGSGKTVLLWELADRARKKGFVVASPTVASEDMPNRIIEKIQDDGERYIKGVRGKLVGGSFGAMGFSVGLQFSSEVQETKSFGYKLLKLSERLEEQGRGILILVDEVQGSSPELKQLISAYLELVGEGRNAAIVFAGLPGAISSVLNDRVLTFLNRAHKVSLSPLTEGDVDAYFSRAFSEAGVQISPALRREAARATKGSPYMLQLVGHNIVQYAGASAVVDEHILQEALESSRISFERDVCEASLAALSGKDIVFLEAMAQDEHESNTGEIAQRMGVTPDYAQKYRKRLIDAGIISTSRRGYVAFAVPYLANYLRSNS